jgi:hypothetical protein
MPDHIDIRLEELLLHEGNELSFDGSDLATCTALEPDTDRFVAQECELGAPSTARRYQHADRGCSAGTGEHPRRRPWSRRARGDRIRGDRGPCSSPAEMLALMRQFAAALARSGWVLRTGGGPGRTGRSATGSPCWGRR